MHLQLDVLLCDRRPRTYPKVTLGNLLAWFITAKLPFISSLPSQSEGFPKMFYPKKLGEVTVRFTPYVAGEQGWKVGYVALELIHLV